MEQTSSMHNINNSIQNVQTAEIYSGSLNIISSLAQKQYANVDVWNLGNYRDW
jgi:hypothetical protein